MSFPPAIPAAPTDEREEDYLAARTSHRALFGGLLPSCGRRRPDLKVRVVIAFAVLLLAKLVTVGVPVLYKDATDRLTASGAHAVTLGQGLAIGIAMLIFAYGTGRVLTMVLTQIRDVIFTEVSQNAVRELNNRTFEHLHGLSLRFHLERRTGGLTRDIERGDARHRAHHPHGASSTSADALEFAARRRNPALLFDWRYMAIIVGDDRRLHVVHVRGDRMAHRASAAR